MTRDSTQDFVGDSVQLTDPAGVVAAFEPTL